MMNDLISRQAAYITLTEYYHHTTEVQHKALREALERVPSAQPKTQLSTEDTTFGTTFDCISRQAAIDEITEYGSGNTYMSVAELKRRIEHLPSAQPEIVRCKECKWSYDDISGRICSHGVCVDCVVSDDFYCADAERREE